jgi:pyruvate dehydrogenase E1 component alpha subunit
MRSVERPQAVAAKPAPSITAEAPAKSSSKASSSKKADISPEVAADTYRDMFLGREFEEMCAQMYYRGKMFGFVHLYSGQEAVSTGVIRQLRQDDYICSTYRDHVHALSKDVPPREIMAELFGKKTGICRGQGGSMHMFSKKHNLVRIWNVFMSCE